MKRNESAAATNMVLFNRLPVEVQKALGGPKNIRLLTGDVLVREKIRDYFQACYALEVGLNAWRKKNGYCQGLPSCDKRVEKDKQHCETCAATYARYRKNTGTRPIQRSAYAVWAAVERAKAKAEQSDAPATLPGPARRRPHVLRAIR